MKLCLYSSILASIVITAVSYSEETDWWMNANLVKRSDDWIRLVADSPKTAAQYLIDLTYSESAHPRRTKAVFDLLNQNRSFPAAIVAVMKAVDMNELDKSLAQGGRVIVEPIHNILSSRHKTSPLIRRRCARILGHTGGCWSVNWA